jgi:hypothetical protein
VSGGLLGMVARAPERQREPLARHYFSSGALLCAQWYNERWR